jgi:hypothetical protein
VAIAAVLLPASNRYLPGEIYSAENDRLDVQHQNSS